MALYYTFKQVDIDKAAGEYFRYYKNGVLVVAGDTVNTNDVISIKTFNGATFILNSGNQFPVKVYFGGNQNNYFFKDGVDPLNPVEGSATISSVSATDKAVLYLTIPATIKSAVPLAWVNHPSNGLNTDTLNYSWTGGTPPAAGYKVIVVKPDSTEQVNADVVGTSYNFTPAGGVGTYTITVSDGTTTLTQAIAITALALEWANHPSSGLTTDTLNYSWTGGNPPAAGYNVIAIKPDNTEQANINVTEKSYSFTPASGAGNYKISVSDGTTTLNQDVIITAPLPELLYTFTAADITALENAHVTLKNNGVAVVAGSEMRLGDNLASTCENGYIFGMVTNPWSASQLIASIYFRLGGKYGFQSAPFTLSEDKKTATFTATATPSTNLAYQALLVTTEQVTPEIVGTNNVYLINDDILSQVNNKRFKTVTSSGSTPDEVVYDYGQFILSVLSLPFTIPDEYIINDENIILANLDTGVSAPALNNDRITFDLGDIVVPSVNGNLLDYANTTVLLHLPRVDTIALESQFVIGHTINIKYVLDCYTGRATINIYSSKTGSIIASSVVDIGVNVPFANLHNNAVLDNGSIEVGGNNGITQPFIEVVRNEPVLPDGFFTIPVIDEALLNTATGFVQVENIELKTDALRNEKEMLINILNSGVIIK